LKKYLNDLVHFINAFPSTYNYLAPSSIRLLTDKVTKKPRGIAFLEFSNSSDLDLALSKHHSDFKGRRINVELTVGGGGNKSENRKKKIKVKNDSLAEERKKMSQKTDRF
jgi:nucleolar protein 6